MRVVVVGLGIQGNKRRAIAGPDVAGTVDPVKPEADFRRIEEVPLASYDAALVCTPDEPKVELLTYLLEHGKHALVEKPLISRQDSDLLRLAELSRERGAVCYTAYNHRFEPHLAAAKAMIDEGRIGAVYQTRLFYGNGTARDVRNSAWRDQGLGVIPDLASHLLDLVLFYFGPIPGEPTLWAHERFENRSCDYFLVGFPGARPMIRLEGTLLSWRNSFFMDIVGQAGSIHVTSLCKWGPTSLIVRNRKLPSGRPEEQTITLEQPDPTWALEYADFKRRCAARSGTNIEHDRWIQRMLSAVSRQAGEPLLA